MGEGLKIAKTKKGEGVSIARGRREKKGVGRQMRGLILIQQGGDVRKRGWGVR